MTWTPTTLTIKDANGVNQPVIAYTDGTNYSFAHPVLDNTGTVIAPATAGNQAAANATLASIVTNTTGAATAANQTSGNTTLTALAASLAAIATASAPVSGVLPLVLDTLATAGRKFAVSSTAAGNVAVTLADGSSDTLPVGVGLFVFPYAVVRVNSAGTTATATYKNWK